LPKSGTFGDIAIFGDIATFGDMTTEIKFRQKEKTRGRSK
jgi:hypothetical protein